MPSFHSRADTTGCRVTPWVHSRSWLGLKIIARGTRIDAFCQGSLFLTCLNFNLLFTARLQEQPPVQPRGHPLSLFGLAKSRRACPSHCPCFCCPAQSSFQMEWDCYITVPRNCIWVLWVTFFLKEYLLVFGCGNSDIWEAAGWFRPHNRKLSAFGILQAKKPIPKTEAKMRNTFLAFVEHKAPFQFFMPCELLK